MTLVKEIPISEAREELLSLPGRLAEKPGAVAVTKHGTRVLAILPWDLYESIAETLDILSDKDLVDALRRGIREVAEGKGIPWEVAKRKLRG